MSLPIFWMVTAFALGSIRARQLKEREGLLQRLAKTERSTSAIVENHKAIKRSKERLEARLAEERCSVLTIYEIAQSLETLDPAEASVAVEKLVRAAFNPGKFSLFMLHGDELRLESAYGWTKADDYARTFRIDEPLISHALGKADYVLSVARQDEGKLLDGQGMLAGLLVNGRSGKLLGMLKIEDIGFMDTGLRNHETFRIVCAWIASAFANIDIYQAALKQRATSVITARARTVTKPTRMKKSESVS